MIEPDVLRDSPGRDAGSSVFIFPFSSFCYYSVFLTVCHKHRPERFQIVLVNVQLWRCTCSDTMPLTLAFLEFDLFGARFCGSLRGEICFTEIVCLFAIFNLVQGILVYLVSKWPGDTLQCPMEMETTNDHLIGSLEGQLREPFQLLIISWFIWSECDCYLDFEVSSSVFVSLLCSISPLSPKKRNQKHNNTYT